MLVCIHTSTYAVESIVKKKKTKKSKKNNQTKALLFDDIVYDQINIKNYFEIK